VFEPGRREIGGNDDEQDEEEDAGAPEADRGRNADRQPDEPVGARVGEPYEHGVEPADAMLDDPPLEAVIEVDQGRVVTVVVTVTVSRVAAIGTTVRTRVCAAPGFTSELVAWPRATPSANTTPNAAAISSARTSGRRRRERRDEGAGPVMAGSLALRARTGEMRHLRRPRRNVPNPAADTARR
jgi:hypothetical protein